jgi:hypothetical protein
MITSLEKSTEYFFRVNVYSQWGKTAASQISVGISTTACQKGYELISDQQKKAEDEPCYGEKKCLQVCFKCQKNHAKNNVGDNKCVTCSVNDDYWGENVEADEGWKKCKPGKMDFI